MRPVPGFLAMMALAGSAAAQSSLVAMEPVGAEGGRSILAATSEPGRLPSPSIVSVRPAAAASEARPVDAAAPSIMTLGTPPRAAAAETVASIPKKADPPALPEMVIRGGLIGDAFPTPAEEEAEARDESTAAPVEDSDGPTGRY